MLLALWPTAWRRHKYRTLPLCLDGCTAGDIFHRLCRDQDVLDVLDDRVRLVGRRAGNHPRLGRDELLEKSV